MDQDREAQHNRLTNNKKSQAARKAWKRHHASYMSGTRKRERNYMNKTFYGVAKEIEEALSESRISRDNVFNMELTISFETISGGVSLKANDEDKTVSISCTLDETGSGAYGLTTGEPDAIKNVYNGLKDDLQNLCNNFDQEFQQLIAKYGLKPTK